MVFQVIYEHLYKCSQMDFGTAYQLQNLHQALQHCQSSKGKCECYSDDILTLLVTCHVIVAAFNLLGITTGHSTPSKQVLSPEAWALPANERKPLFAPSVTLS